MKRVLDKKIEEEKLASSKGTDELCAKASSRKYSTLELRRKSRSVYVFPLTCYPWTRTDYFLFFSKMIRVAISLSIYAAAFGNVVGVGKSLSVERLQRNGGWLFPFYDGAPMSVASSTCYRLSQRAHSTFSSVLFCFTQGMRYQHSVIFQS